MKMTSLVGTGLLISAVFVGGCAASSDEEPQDNTATASEALCATKPPVYIGSYGGYATYYNGCGYYQVACSFPQRVEYMRALCGNPTSGFYTCVGLTGNWKVTGTCR